MSQYWYFLCCFETDVVVFTQQSHSHGSVSILLISSPDSLRRRACQGKTDAGSDPARISWNVAPMLSWKKVFRYHTRGYKQNDIPLHRHTHTCMSDRASSRPTLWKGQLLLFRSKQPSSRVLCKPSPYQTHSVVVKLCQLSNWGQ